MIVKKLTVFIVHMWYNLKMQINVVVISSWKTAKASYVNVQEINKKPPIMFPTRPISQKTRPRNSNGCKKKK